MRHIRYTLITDGPSDDALLYPIQWLLDETGSVTADGDWADLSLIAQRPRGLNERVIAAVEHFPCDVLFVHRDAEHPSLSTERHREIVEAIRLAELTIPYICVIPVRMTEAWLLHDEAAIRSAALRPRGREALHLPQLSHTEDLADPKDTLFSAMITASGANGRRLKRFRRNLGHMRRRVAELIEDWSPLRDLSAFQAFEADLIQVLDELLLAEEDA
jgi:hypothetical protein